MPGPVWGAWHGRNSSCTAWYRFHYSNRVVHGVWHDKDAPNARKGRAPIGSISLSLTVPCGFRRMDGPVPGQRGLPTQRAMQDMVDRQSGLGGQSDGPVGGGRDYPRTVSCTLGKTDDSVRGGWPCPCTVPCRFGQTNSSVQSQWPCPHTVPCVFRRMDGLVWGNQDCLRTVPCRFWQTNGPVQGSRDYPCTVPSWFVQTDGPVQGGRECPRTVPCTL